MKLTDLLDELLKVSQEIRDMETGVKYVKWMKTEIKWKGYYRDRLLQRIAQELEKS